MTHLTPRSGVSIFLILAYTPALFLSILLTVRHGLSRSSGWRFLLTFALARLLAASFQLATIAQPTNTSLYIGEWVLLGIALSPLELTLLGLLSRVVGSINRGGVRRTVLTPRHIRIAQLFNTVGLVLGIVGGVKAGEGYEEGGMVMRTETKVAVALFVATFCAIVVGAGVTWARVEEAETGEKRVLAAVGAAVPFLAVRVVYTIMSTFGGRAEFSLLFGSLGFLVGMALVMELVIVYILLGVGLTLKKVVKEEANVEEESHLPAKASV